MVKCMAQARAVKNEALRALKLNFLSRGVEWIIHCS